MSSPLPITFLQSASRLHQLPDRALELAIVGRSNVGKSSLINALANRKKLAKTSKTPGATQLIKCMSYHRRGLVIGWLIFQVMDLRKLRNKKWSGGDE